MLRKNTLALAVSTALLAPISAQADGLYGFVSVGIENASIDGAGAGNEIFAGSTSDSTHAQDVAETRFGYKGSKQLGGGMTAGFQIEFGLGITPGAGAPNEDTSPTTRLAQVSLSGDFGTFTAGNQWGVLYEYLGWNVYRSHGHGAGTWYWTTKNLNDDAFGLRVSNAFTYTHGGGGYSTDPFTFSVQVIADPDTPANDEFMDAVVLGAAFTSGDLTINAVSYSESDGSGAAEPGLIGIGARYQLSPETYVGGNFMTVDNDAGADITSFNILASHDLGNGLSGMLGYGQGDGDNAIADLDSNLFFTLQKDYGQGVIAYIEVETAELSSGDETQIIAANLKYNF